MRFFYDLLLLIVICAFCSAKQQNAASTLPPPTHVKVSENVASALLVQKTALTYPSAARNAGTQGTVVLKVIISSTGDVKGVTVISGDPILGEAAAEAVRHWKYKPYTLEGRPVEMETEVSIKFHLKEENLPSPSVLLGTFNENAYVNAYFDLFYPLSRDWVRETELIRKRFVAEKWGSGVYILLAAVHIPEHTAPLEADSSFVLSAIESISGSTTENCQRYLENLAADLSSGKETQEKGEVGEFSVAGRDFRSTDFKFRRDPRFRTTVCTQAKSYLLQWNVSGLSKSAVDNTVLTIKTLTPLPSSLTEQSVTQEWSNTPRYVKISSEIAKGLKIRQIDPVYPEEARRAQIQGSVDMRAVISKSGDVEDVEVIDGPIELVVSAVNAVRQWKYRPYVMNGTPVKFDIKITVDYHLT
jgi:TonB family protein